MIFVVNLLNRARMKSYLIATLFLFTSFIALSQDTTINNSAFTSTYKNKTTLITLSFGVGDWNKTNYKLPDSFKHSLASFSLPVYLKLEHAISSSLGIAVSLAYDAFYYNYMQRIYFNGTENYRLYSDKFSVVSPGVGIFYHFNKVIPVRNLDVFLGVGGTLNFINHTNFPRADTLSSQIKTTESIMIKLGARYYVNRHASFFGDIGYDQFALLSLGASYRF